MLLLHADLRIAASASAAAASCYFYPTRDLRRGRNLAAASGPVLLHSISTTTRASSSYHRPIQASVSGSKEIKKPPICTADELHYVPVPGTEWRLALWRYLPSPEAPKRNHPLMLLSGVGTNAIGYDLSPGASFARHMSSQGFDTWVVEVRGAGLSMRTVDSKAIEQFIDKPYLDSSDEDNFSSLLTGQQQSVVNSAPVPNTKITANRNKKEIIPLDESQLVMKLSATFLRLAERLSGYLNEGQLKAISSKFFDRIAKLLEDARLSERFDEIRASILGLLEARQNSAVAGQLRELSQRLVNVIEEGQRSVSPQLFDLQERLSATIEDFQSQLDLIIIYDWDFDNYLEEDVPAAMQYIRQQSMSSDGKLLAIGHSMGGILLYAMLARYNAEVIWWAIAHLYLDSGGSEGVKSHLAAVVTLASSLDYTTSKSSLKALLPLVDPAQALNVPVVPLGALLAAAYPLSSRPPYVLSWLTPQVSAPDMMHPELFEKLVLNNFCTIPAKVLLQLASAFKEGGLRNRAGNFPYKDHLHKCEVPVLALAADQDLICPPEAVYGTVKLFPPHICTCKTFGKPDGPHYGHYDLVGGRAAVDEVYPCIIDFLSCHDSVSSS